MDNKKYNRMNSRYLGHNLINDGIFKYYNLPCYKCINCNIYIAYEKGLGSSIMKYYMTLKREPILYTNWEELKYNCDEMLIKNIIE